MINKCVYKKSVFLLLGALFLALAFPFSTFAKGVDSHFVVFDLKGDRGYDSSVLSNRTIRVWRIPDKEGLRDPQSFLSQLEGLSLDQLDKRLGKFTAEGTSKAEDAYKIRLSLPSGQYYAREVLSTPRGEKIISFIFNVPTEDSVILPKWELERKPGKVILYKVGPEGKPLKGVGFRLFFHPDNIYGKGEVPLRNHSYDKGGKAEILYTDGQGHIEVEGLLEGEYFFREVAPLKGYIIDSRDNAFTLTKEGARVKVVNRPDKEDNGSIHFIKVDKETKKPLKGAVFALNVMEGKEYKRVQRNGTDLILSSDGNGKFSLTSLAYGTYYLWETSAPNGYEALTEPVKFEVNRDSRDQLMYIENTKKKLGPAPKENGTKKTPPGRGTIPKTGDIALILMAMMGLLLVGVGTYLVREERQK